MSRSYIMFRNRVLAICLVLSIGIAVSGCAAVMLGGAAAGGSYVYVTGQAKQKFNADLAGTYKAALKVCKNLNLKIEDSKKKLSEASIKAKDADTAVIIDLTYVSSKVTDVSVRYGILGDEAASKRVLAEINKSF